MGEGNGFRLQSPTKKTQGSDYSSSHMPDNVKGVIGSISENFLQIPRVPHLFWDFIIRKLIVI